MACHDDFTCVNTSEMDTDSSVPPAVDVDTSPSTAATTSVGQGKESNSLEGSPSREDTKLDFHSEANKKYIKDSGGGGGEFQSCTKIVNEMLEARETLNNSENVYDRETDLNLLGDSQIVATEELSDKNSDKSMEEKRKDDSMEEKRNDESMEEKRRDENMEEKRNDESMEEKRSDENMEEKRNDESLEEKRKDDSMEEKRSNESMEEKRSDENMEEKRSDESMEEKMNDNSMEEKRSDENMEEKMNDNSMEGKRSDESMEGKRSNESMGEKRNDENMEGKRSDESMEGKRNDESMEGKRSNESMEGKRSDESMEGKRSDESMEGKRNDESMEREERAKDNSEGTPQKNKQNHAHSKQAKQTHDGEAGEACGEGELITTPKKRGRPRKTKDGEVYFPPCRRKNPHIARLPGSTLKICSHCGTVADKVKAKKCFKCKKFFFSHWAQRCKIPPCPNCHFSRKSRRFERVPPNCEKCGFKLPYEMIEQSVGTSVEDCDGMESVESSSTSARATPDPSDFDGFPAEWSEGKPDECFDDMVDDEVEMEEEVEEKKPGKGKGKKRGRGETSSSVAQSLSAMNFGLEGATVVMATTRSGKAYKQNTALQHIYGGRVTDSQFFTKKSQTGSVPADNATSQENPSLPHTTTPPLKEQGISTSEISKDSSKSPQSPAAQTADAKDSEHPEDTTSLETPPPASGEADESEKLPSVEARLKEASVSTHPLSPITTPATEPRAAPPEAEPAQPPHAQSSPGEQEKIDRPQEVEMAGKSSRGTSTLVDQEVQVAPSDKLAVEENKTFTEERSTAPERLCDESGAAESEGGSASSMPISSEQAEKVPEDSSCSKELSMEEESVAPPVSKSPTSLFTLSSAVQTEGGVDREDERREKGEIDEGGKLGVFSNINRSLPFLRSVLGCVDGVSEQDDSLRAHSVPGMDVATCMSTTTSGGTQSLPVLYTSSLGLEDPGKSQLKTQSRAIVPSAENNFPTTSMDIQAEASNTTANTLLPFTCASTSTGTENVAGMYDDMVVTESGTLPSIPGSLLSGAKDPKATVREDQPAAQKPGKGKGAVGKDGKPLTSRKRKQSKSQEKKEETKQSKPRKPRTKKAKVMTAAAPSVTEEQSTAAISMLATSIAQELQRKPNLSSPMVMGQHPKHSFSQYFYTEDGKLASSASPGLGTSSATGPGFGKDSEAAGTTKTSSKRSPSKLKDSQEPPLKKKKLATIAPNNPLTPTVSTAGGGIGQLPLKLPQLCQLASTFRMSSSSLLSLLQTVLSTQNSFSTSISSGNIVSSASSTSVVSCSSSSAATPNPLTPNLFPPLTMSFQSLAAVLSNMPIATAPIRLSGTQVTARPLLPSTVTSSALTATVPSPTVTLPLSLATMFPSLGPPGSVSGEQLLAQSEASVGTQTAVKIDNLKSLVPAISSSLSPQLLTLPNPPQLTSGPAALPLSVPSPAPPPSLVPRDLKPLFQSVLSSQHPSPPPPPLSSSHLTSELSLATTSSSTAVLPLPVIQSNTTSLSCMTLPVTSASMFPSLSFLSAPHSSILPFPPERTSITPPRIPTGGGDPTMQPLLISSLPEPIMTISTSSQPLAGLGSLLPPPPHLLSQPPYPLSSSTSSSLFPHTLVSTGEPSSSSTSVFTSSHHLMAPLIPSLLRAGVSSVVADLGSISSQPGSVLPSLGHHQQKVIYTQSVTSPKVCPGLQPVSSAASVDSNLQVLATNVQSRINEVLSKVTPEAKPQDTPTPITTATIFPPAPPPLTPAPPLAFTSKGASSSHPQYLLPHPPPQKKRGVVITKLPGPFSTSLGHAGDLRSQEGSRHSSTSSLKSGDDPSVVIQSAKSSTDAIIAGFSSAPLTVITLSPSPTASLEEGQVVPGNSRDKPQILDQDSDKESDSYAKLMSEETLASDGSSEGEGLPGSKVELVGGAGGPGDQRREQQQLRNAGPGSDTDPRKSEKERERVQKEGGEEGGREKDGDKGKLSKKRRKSSSGGSSKKTHMFSVKLKDCFLHHLTWMDYRMVLLVPLGEKERQSHTEPQDLLTRPQLPPNDPTQETHLQEAQGQSSETGDKPPASGSGEGGGGERRRRRKPVLKELSGYDMEDDEDDTSQSTTSSGHVPGPCFSVYELRNKLFQTLSPNSVYIYTYKNQIKSFKLPIHWVYILKRMGGMLESCHTCRLMDLEHVRGMCTHYGLSLPDTLYSLCRNELPKGRRVIDLSSIEPESLGPLHLEEIPLCSFTEKGRPYKPKSKKNKKKCRKDEEHRSKKKAEVDRKSGRESEGGEREQAKEQSSGGVNTSGKVPRDPTRSSLPAKRELMEGEEEEMEEEEEGEGAKEEEGQGGGGEGEERRREMEEWVEDEREWKNKYKFGKRSPPPLIKRPVSPISSRTKKKPCPYCGAQVLKRSKKCTACNKNFGVYTFGRRQCLFCGRVNLARMARCNECGQSLDKAPIARPKEGEESFASSSSSSSSHKKSDFIFGVRKRRKVHSVPLAFSGGYHGYHQLPSSSSGKMRRSNESLGDGSRGAQGELSGEEEMEGEGGREELGEEEEGEEEGGAEEMQEEDIKPSSEAETTKSKSKARPKSASKHTGYQYGHIPWADADITVLVDEKGVTKFCLQELIAKVLVGHTKVEVLDMVQDLDLPLEQGNVQLLKKLQALGLHANRSPMCKLIASEELWLLLDALQEPVPEEVHQHLENISASTTPLLSPSSSARTAAVVATAPPTTNSAEEEEQTKSFESTLHEMQCSDGQYISVLRKWNGEQYACLPEMWRKYFPEVNRNHLSSALRRLELETFMPTAQQATLLRSAQVISIRGAPGRLMKLDHMQALLDDFCIPLQLASGSTQEQDPATAGDKQKQSAPAITGVPKQLVASSRQTGRPRVQSSSFFQPHLPPGKVLASREDMEYAQCMRHVLTAVNSSDLVALLEQTRMSSGEQVEEADSEAADVDSQLDGLGQLIHTRRDLSTVLSREMGFLNASVHGYMAEVVRLSHTEKQVLQNLDTLLHSLKISLV